MNDTSNISNKSSLNESYKTRKPPLMVKISQEITQKILDDLCGDYTGREIAEKHDVSEKTVQRIKNKHIEKIVELKHAKEDIRNAYLKCKINDVSMKIVDSITVRKISSSNLLSLTNALKNLQGVLYGDRIPSNININFDLGNILDLSLKASKDRIIDIKPVNIVQTSIISNGNGAKEEKD